MEGNENWYEIGCMVKHRYGGSVNGKLKSKEMANGDSQASTTLSVKI